MKKRIIISLLITSIFLTTSCVQADPSQSDNQTIKALNKMVEDNKKEIKALKLELKKMRDEIQKEQKKKQTKKTDTKKKTKKHVENYKHNVPLSEPGMENIDGYIDVETIADPYIIKKVTRESLINKFNWLPHNYKPDDLVLINSNSARKIYLRKEAAEAFEKMRKDALDFDIKFVVFSGYRSYETQQKLYSQKYKKDKLRAIKGTAYPGSSEHSSGFAMDISYNNNFPKDFYSTPQGFFLDENAHKYGFILRYPEGKEHITNYKYESWHYRYVGVKLAKELKKKGITLEEYYGVDKYK